MSTTRALSRICASSTILFSLSISSTLGFHDIAFSSSLSIRSTSHTVSRRRAETLQAGAADLPTNLEWLAKERGGDDGGALTGLKWFSTTNPEQQEIDVSVKQRLRLRMPLYPLDATYMPSKIVQFINNVQPRNIKMMTDIKFGDAHNFTEDNVFCVVLRAADTGRLSTIGIRMRVIELDKQLSYGGEVVRIMATCVPEDRMKIMSIENPEIMSPENRLRQQSEYLVAQVSPYYDEKDYNQTLANPAILQSLENDYSVVRNFYINGDGVALRELPPFAVDGVQKIPEITGNEFADYEQFWKAADVWQTLCNTVKEGRRAMLQSEMNEIMIDAAMKKGGPLNLPVRSEDLPFEVRKLLQQKEEKSMRDFHQLGLDPCLDFQAIISAKSHEERLKLLSKMISRERRRLEAKESLKSIFANKQNHN